MTDRPKPAQRANLSPAGGGNRGKPSPFPFPAPRAGAFPGPARGQVRPCPGTTILPGGGTGKGNGPILSPEGSKRKDPPNPPGKGRLSPTGGGNGGKEGSLPQKENGKASTKEAFPQKGQGCSKKSRAGWIHRSQKAQLWSPSASSYRTGSSSSRRWRTKSRLKAMNLSSRPQAR